MDVIADFERRWRDLDSLMRDFVDSVPEDAWMFTPHPRFAPFAKQLRHVVCVRGTYAAGMRTGSPDFSLKHSHYHGDLSRASLTAALTEQSALLIDAANGVGDRAIAFANRSFDLPEFAFVIVQHEAIHMGQWSIYASLAAFETPLSWRLGWGL